MMDMNGVDKTAAPHCRCYVGSLTAPHHGAILPLTLKPCGIAVRPLAIWSNPSSGTIPVSLFLGGAEGRHRLWAFPSLLPEGLWKMREMVGTTRSPGLAFPAPNPWLFSAGVALCVQTC